MTITATIWKNKSFKIEPCILVTERLTIDRAVSYERHDKNVTTYADGSEDATWETQRHFRSKEEAKLADQVYANARYKIRSKCLFTEIGYVCPETKKAELEKAIKEARVMVNDANKDFIHCKIVFRVVCTPLLPDNTDATKIVMESLDKVREDVREAVASFDFKKVRNVLSSTRELAGVLGNREHRVELNAFREQIRGAATDMASLVKTYGNAENAITSAEGQGILKRTKAAWNF